MSLLKGRENMDNHSIAISDCPCCKNCVGHGRNDPPLRCGAFPNGIPKEYLFGPIQVRDIPECGNGYRYEEIEE